MSTLSKTPDHSPLIQTDGGNDICAMVFMAKGEHLASGDQNGIQVWQVADGQQVTAMPAENIWCLAASSNGRWLAAGTFFGKVIVWDGLNSYEQVFEHKETWGIQGVDFSPDSARLVVLGTSKIAIWDFTTHKQIQTLRSAYLGSLVAAKYSPKGDRIAIATDRLIRVLDSGNINGRAVAEILGIGVTPDCNTGLVWSHDSESLFVVSYSAIKRFDASTGTSLESPTSKWTVPGSQGLSCIVLPQHAESIVYSTDSIVTLWNISTQSELGVIHHPHKIYSIAVSPNDHFLAVGGEGGKITIKSLSNIVDSFPLPCLHPTFQEPEIYIYEDLLQLWKLGRFKNAEALLTYAIGALHGPENILYATRALIRACSEQWDKAIEDADKAATIQPSVIGYIAKSMALVGKGETYEAYRNCDIAFERFHTSHVSFLLLFKAILVFLAGEHHDAISRMKDLIDTVRHNSICYVVQAHMYLLLGKSYMDQKKFEDAIQSFEIARKQIRSHESRPLTIISLISGWSFDDLEVVVQRHHCDALRGVGNLKEAVDCFHQITKDPREETNWPREHLKWVLKFKEETIQQLMCLGDTAAGRQCYDEAISCYTQALSLDPPSLQLEEILINRSKAFMALPSWQEALDDADKVIQINQSSPWGWEMKHAALHEARRYEDAVHAFEVMYSNMEQSTELGTQQRYKDPSRIRKRIRKVIVQTLQDSPRVLINTTTGTLHDRDQQIAAFESLPIFNELISSMTTQIDRARIRNEVQQYFRYVMLSHRWEENEPLFHSVLHLDIRDLSPSPTHDKLKMFCEVARKAGFHWAWSDTCCINKSDQFILQAALVAMFRWYHGAALVIVFLRGVPSSTQRDARALTMNEWNTRGWTLQEYIAAKVVRFYTEDWTPYLDLQLDNHKEAQDVILEMARATGMTPQQLKAIRPGLASIRDKLRLASTRETKEVEDAAYSLFGIFSVTGLHVIYGEGREAALGRLLSYVLTTSGDASILAWTGESGQFNSCLPTHIRVFNDNPTTHLPSHLPDAEMDRIIAAFPPSFDLNTALKLYDHLYELHAPWFVASRMKLPCIAFELPPLHRLDQGHATFKYCVNTVAFGSVTIKTRQDLSQIGTAYLVHPWLDTILQREHSGPIIEHRALPPSEEASTADGELSDVALSDDASMVLVPESPPRPSPHGASTPLRHTSLDKAARARRLVVRLRQPFGALLVTLAGQRSVDFRRVAADGLIIVQIKEDVPLADILANVRTLDIL